ncbi:unnamed protein product, partial [Rotaria sp. Silwood2]
LIRRNPSDCMSLNEVIKHERIIRNTNIKSIDDNYQKVYKSTFNSYQAS